MIDILVPDVPKSLETKMKRERYLAKQLLRRPDQSQSKVSKRTAMFYFLLHEGIFCSDFEETKSPDETIRKQPEKRKRWHTREEVVLR